MENKEGKKNLMPLGRKGNEEADAKVRAKLKGSASHKRKLAQQVRRIKESDKSGNVDKIAQLIVDPSCSARQIQEMISHAAGLDLKPSEFIQLINTTISKHRTLFGDKLKIDANINIKGIEEEYNLREMIMRLMDFTYSEKCLKEWTKRFGEEQAIEMRNCILYKYLRETKDFQSHVGQAKREIKILGFRDESNVVIEDYTEEEYAEFEKKAKGVIQNLDIMKDKDEEEEEVVVKKRLSELGYIN